MLVVADASPLILLVKIEHLDVLPALYRQVVLPPQVILELSGPSRPPEARRLAANRPSWLLEQNPVNVQTIPNLDQGEQAAISLALEINADLLLIDETFGRDAARHRGLQIAGAIGVLETAADAKLLDLDAAFARVKQTNFWISHAFLDKRLHVHRAKAGGAL